MDRRSFLLGWKTEADYKKVGTKEKSEEPGRSLQSVPSLAPYTGEWNRATILHLLRRTLLTPTYSELQAAQAMTMEGLVDRLLDQSLPLPSPPRYCRDWLNEPERYFHSGRQHYHPPFVDELRRWWCGLMANTTLSIRERMTLFWHNHFACEALAAMDHRDVYLQNQLLRNQALGNFKTLVHDMTLDKQMLRFLNNEQNKLGSVNENYARELQELFTLGVTDNEGNPNYTQKDVAEIARVLTGWTWFGPGMTGKVKCYTEYGIHDTGDKVIYGKPFKGSRDGEDELNRLLDLIFEKESTARYVVRKLYRFFLNTDVPLTPFFPISEEIETNIIAPLAEEFRRTNWSIAAVLRTLLLSEHFYDAGLRGSQVKSPIDLYVGIARSMLTGPLQGAPLEKMMQLVHLNAREMGQDLFVPPGVQGWPFYRYWISSITLPQRRKLTDALIDGHFFVYAEVFGDVENTVTYVQGYTKLDATAYARQFPSYDLDPLRLIDEIVEHQLAFPPSERLRAHLVQSLLQGQPPYEWVGFPEDAKASRLQAMLKVLMRSANFQLL